MSTDDVLARLRDGMTLGIGGWGSRRKPMALVRAIARSSLRDLTIVSFGGPDVGMLCAAGKVRRVVYGFVSLDSIALDPHFRRARETGAVEAVELDEGMLYLGLQAAAWRVPFLPTRAGLGSDLATEKIEYRGETLVAMPALELDAALCHVHRADAAGNGQILGPDPFFDELFCAAAKLRFLSCERIVPTGALLAEHCIHTLRIPRLHVDGVVETPRGAHFTSCEPDYPRDEAAQREYVNE